MKSKPKSKPLMIYIEPEYKEKLKELARKKKFRSVSDYVRRLIIREIEKEQLREGEWL